MKTPNKKSKLGGKGSALIKLTEAGFPIPNFFIIPVGEKLNPYDLAKLSSKKLAVRSSAMIEDGKRHSFAGQFLTLLDVSPKDVQLAVEKVKASGPGDLPAGRQVAVIVQEMIHGETSGVAFSANPVTGNKNEIVIESVKGLGDKLVSGRATPKMKIIKKQSAKDALSKLVLKAEKHFGYPVDVEWIRKGRKVYILQCRPITTL